MTRMPRSEKTTPSCREAWTDSRGRERGEAATLGGGGGAWGAGGAGEEGAGAGARWAPSPGAGFRWWPTWGSASGTASTRTAARRTTGTPQWTCADGEGCSAGARGTGLENTPGVKAVSGLRSQLRITGYKLIYSKDRTRTVLGPQCRSHGHVEQDAES